MVGNGDKHLSTISGCCRLRDLHSISGRYPTHKGQVFEVPLEFLAKKTVIALLVGGCPPEANALQNQAGRHTTDGHYR